METPIDCGKGAGEGERESVGDVEGEILHNFVAGMFQYLSSQTKAKIQTKTQTLNKEPKNVTNLSNLSSFNKNTDIRKY